jgi:hypothetical protein
MIASPSASVPGGSHIATAAKSSTRHTVWLSNAAPPKAATNAGNWVRYAKGSG